MHMGRPKEFSHRWKRSLLLHIVFATCLCLNITVASTLHINEEKRLPSFGTLSEFTIQQSFYHTAENDDGSVHVLQHNHGDRRVYQQGTAGGSTHTPTSLKLRALPNSYRKYATISTVLQQYLEPTSILPTPPATRPNITDKQTIINLAKMTHDAYYADSSTSSWLNVTHGFNDSQSFGWEEDGLRGHVFANSNNSTVVISFKGTAVTYGEHTRSNDHENDNILFSCCCATQRPFPYWYGSACSCRTKTYSCNSTCLTQECARPDRYYVAGMQVLLNVSATYPHAQIWLVGHSLGGAIASLVGRTFNLPAVTFESPPERLPAERLGLVPSLPARSDSLIGRNGGSNGAGEGGGVNADESEQGPSIYHFGNTADPVYMGACNGHFSSCSAFGFAFESQCFTGRRCDYDTVKDLGWHVNVLNHRIITVIKSVLEVYDDVPACDVDDECVDCYNWQFS